MVNSHMRVDARSSCMNVLGTSCRCGMSDVAFRTAHQLVGFLVLPMLLYERESWTLTVDLAERRIQAFEN